MQVMSRSLIMAPVALAFVFALGGCDEGTNQQSGSAQEPQMEQQSEAMPAPSDSGETQSQ
jgi:hypothetical protein